MRYRTKKYLLLTLKYTVFLFALLNLYIYAAHRNALPALFEFYTGDYVRSHSSEVYRLYGGETQVKSTETEGTFYDFLDLFVQDPVYLYARDLLESKSKEADVETPFRRDAHSLVTHPALIQWLQTPHSRYASVFKFEFLRYADTMVFIKNLQILDKKEKPLYSAVRNFTSPPRADTDFQIEDGKFLIKVKSGEELIGYLAGELDSESYRLNHFSVPEPAYGITAILTDENKRVQNISSLERWNIVWVKDGMYNQISNGRIDGARVISAKIGDLTLVLLYGFKGWLYYSLQLLFRIALPVVAVIFLLYLRNNIGNIVRWFQTQTRNKEFLEQAITLQQESLEFSKECEEKMVKMRQEELEKLRMIGRHLEGIHAGLEKQNSENKLLNEVF